MEGGGRGHGGGPFHELPNLADVICEQPLRPGMKKLNIIAFPHLPSFDRGNTALNFKKKSHTSV